MGSFLPGLVVPGIWYVLLWHTQCYNIGSSYFLFTRAPLSRSDEATIAGRRTRYTPAPAPSPYAPPPPHHPLSSPPSTIPPHRLCVRVDPAGEGQHRSRRGRAEGRAVPRQVQAMGGEPDQAGVTANVVRHHGRSAQGTSGGTGCRRRAPPIPGYFVFIVSLSSLGGWVKTAA